MKNEIIVLLFLFYTVTVFTQDQKKYSIEKQAFSFDYNVGEYEYKDENKGKFIVRDYISFTDPAAAGEFKLPSSTILIAIPPDSKPEITISEIDENYEYNIVPKIQPSFVRESDSTYTLLETDFKLPASAKNDIYEVLGYSWYREYYCMILKINTHKYDIGKSCITSIKSLNIRLAFDREIISASKRSNDEDKFNYSDIIYNYDISLNLKGRSSFSEGDRSSNWINFSSKYVKLSVGKDGIYRIKWDDLLRWGIQPSEIIPGTIQLFRKGTEEPVFVKGEEDNSFDEGDYIEFWGTMNYGDSSHLKINASHEEYNEYLNRYTDSSYYFLTWNAESGRRINNKLNGIIQADTVDFYNCFRHYETNTMYQNCNHINDLSNEIPSWNKNKTLYWNWISTSPRTFTFSPADLYPNKDAVFRFKIVSYASSLQENSHNLALKVNDTSIDSQTINRYDQLLLNGKINSNYLITNNKVTVHNFPNESPVNSLALDWYEIEYPRYLKLENDSLLFELNDEYNKTPAVIKIGNANGSQYTIYKKHDFPERIGSYNILNKNLYISDTISNKSKYIVISDSKISAPVFIYYNRIPDLSKNNQADYIAITSEDLLQGAEAYTNTISELYNLNTKVINTAAIFDQFSYGYPYPEAIKTFLSTVMAGWESPKPSYIVLIGDATYDYKDELAKNSKVKLSINKVPAYGIPVSDNWYAILDPLINVPQFKMGRIPVQTANELEYYRSKIISNYYSSFDKWNKNYLFFSGGDGKKLTELLKLRAVNESIIDNLIDVPPISGFYNHFYRTVSPTSDFGPYTPEEVQNAIDSGAVFISYIGHSGTANWDNSIISTSQLKNKFNRNPLITDFGCSTAKFAEPDIISFGEQFLIGNEGQALAYIGNSSLGFVSIATVYPLMFYSGLLNDSTREIGSAHISSKMELFRNYGSSELYSITYNTNTLLGDPAVRLQIPVLPNLTFNQSDVYYDTEKMNEHTDSLLVRMFLYNLGSGVSDSVTISIIHNFNDTLLYREEVITGVPAKLDTINFWAKIRKLSGRHSLIITVNENKELSEVTYEDNRLDVSFNIHSVKLRDLLVYDSENSINSDLYVLNPAFASDSLQLSLLIADDDEFKEYNELLVNLDTFYTQVKIENLQPDKRYWFKYKLKNSDEEYLNTKSFIHHPEEVKFYLSDSLSLASQLISNLQYQSGSLILSDDTVTIAVYSSGFHSGKSCVISKNGINILDNTLFAGMAIVVLDPENLKTDTTATYTLFGQPNNVKALADFINTIPEGKIVVMGVADDARNNMSTELKNAIKTLGSSKIDSLVFRGSWALIGKKGAAPGDVLEIVKGPYDGTAKLETSYVIPAESGMMTTKRIGPAVRWKNIILETAEADSSNLNIRISGINGDNQHTELKSTNSSEKVMDISWIDPLLYPYISISVEISSQTDSPKLSKLGVNYAGVPELGVNSQTMHAEKDTIIQGDSLSIYYDIFNAGESDADSITVNLSLIKPDNSKKLLTSDKITVSSFSAKSMSYNYLSNKSDGAGVMTFLIEIDPVNRIKELYKDNNIFSVLFVIKPDTNITSVSSANVALQIDGIEIMDGDFVNPEPEINIVLSYPVWFPVQDTTAVEFYLNNSRINYSDLEIDYDTVNRKILFSYRPVLEEGEYTLSIFGENVYGQIDQSPGLKRTFNVLNELKIFSVYNYPNPINNDTYFTFVLPEVPEELTIKVFTVAGRIIREIKLLGSELNTNFNKVYWDGRDQDGDLAANGVYIYKVIAKKGSESFNVIQKLAVVR